jgi:glutamyl-tRNA synthetase
MMDDGRMMNDRVQGDVVRGRLAPSPTGALHLGNARSFLLAWLSVRSRGGTLVLRVEDLDHPKVKAWAMDQALDDLRWLGLDWDEGPDVGGPHGPYLQRKRMVRYRQALDRLIAQGVVYPCICSRKDVENAQSAPHADDESLKYPGFCRKSGLSYEEAAGRLEAPRVPAWRFRTQAGDVTEYEDGFHGLQRACVQEKDGDFVVARHREGAGYMLAVVVDDAAMQINEVLRGDDLLPATHRQILLYRALGLTPPAFTHVPLVVGENGWRLAKRHGDTRLSMLREKGVDPRKVLGLLAWWCGWVPYGTEISAQELVPRYDVSAIPKEPVVLTQDVKAYLGIG